MSRRRYSCWSALWALIQIAVGVVLLLMVARWRAGVELPALVPTAAAASELALAETWATTPATYTAPADFVTSGAEPSFLATPAATSTLPSDAVVPVAAPPPTPVPTPFVAPAYLQRAVTVQQVEQPPLTAECGEQGTLFRSRYPSTVFGPWRSYHAYLPPCYGQDGRVYPVLYLLHGSGWTDAQWVELGIAQHIDAGIQEGRYAPFVAIMPNDSDINDRTSGGPRSVEGVFLENLLPYVEANFCAWPSREGRALAGISRGGYWALMLAFRHTDLFSAVSGHSSQLRPEVDPAEYNPLASYTTADLSDLSIWLDWGEYDFLRAGQVRLHEELMTASIPHQATVNPGGHSQSYWYANARSYLDWHAQHWPVAREAYPVCEENRLH